MSIKFFGQFLLERGKITREQLMEAVAFQKSVNLKLGTIALDKGYLSAPQVNQIHAEQQRTDKLFGEIALELGLLSTEQVEELLKIQKGDHIFLGQALVQKNFLSLEDLGRELEEFKKEQATLDQQAREAIRSADTPEVAEAFLDLTLKMLLRLADLRAKVLGSHRQVAEITPFEYNVQQKFMGDLQGFYLLSLSTPLLLQIASALAQEEFQSVDAYAQDGIKEFVNITVGNAVSKLSLAGIKINLQPPVFVDKMTSLEQSQELVVIKLGTADNEMSLGIVHKPIVVA